MQPGGEMAAGGGHGNVGGLWGQQPRRGGGSPAAALAPPPLKLGDGAGMEEGFHLTAAALEEENSWSLMT